jgi:renalase
MPIVVGGGISGIACGRELQRLGVEPTVLDRGRAAGGRMATRTLRDTGTPWDGHIVDIGASYFTVSDAEFQVIVDDWQARDLVRTWTDTFHVADPTGVQGVRTGPMRYAATLGLRSLVQDLAQPLSDVRSETAVERVTSDDAGLRVDAVATDAVALCMPLPQAQQLWPVPSDHIVWEPVIVVTAVFEERVWADFDGVFVNDDPILTWIADDGRRRGDDAAVLVAHTNPVFAAMHLNDPKAVLPATLEALTRVLHLTDRPTFVDVHRWTYAKPSAAHPDPFWRATDVPIGLAGDAWSDGPKVEAAWCSGTALGRALSR